jgi:hypothetical protein
MNHPSRLVAATGCAALLLLGVAPVAQAGEGRGADTSHRGARVEHVKPAREAKRGSSASGADRARVERHLEQQARAGRLLDLDDVKVVSVPAPDGDGVIGAVWEDQSDLVELVVATAAPDAGSELLGLGAVFAEDPVSGGADLAVVATGTGADGGINPVNMTKKGGSCRTVFWDASYSTTDHFTTTCYEKWQQNGSRNWIYNRWALADPANGDQTLERGELIDFTIRSKPWKGYESRVTGIQDWTPNPTSSCTTFDATLGFSANNVNASLKIPLVTCNAGISVFPNATARSMGTDWNGRTQAQVKLDFGLELTASSSTTTPIYADYVWIEVQHCFDPLSCAPWNPSEYEIWTDSGW